jgi:2-polyprenyl-6-methoxyphenol hydroxylase-like FAD-dependent oxidoreductase
MNSNTGHRFPHYDAVVVGARCAGAATSMLLARRGLRVLVVERSAPGTDTLSTHALMRTGVLQLARWGLLDDVKRSSAPAVRTTTFHYGDETLALPIKKRNGVDGLYAPRRTVLDALLVDAARRAGAEVVFGQTVTNLVRAPDGRVCGITVATADGSAEQIRADLVIGADGVRSTVARLAGAEVRHAGKNMTSCVYGYFDGLEQRGYHWYYRPGVSAGAIPTNDGRTCVFVSVPDRRFRTTMRSDLDGAFLSVLAESDAALAPAVSRSSRHGRLMAFTGCRGFLRQSWGPGWALVGDAGYFKDPLTAHGISDALRDAELLARAIDGGRSLAEYQARRDELSLRLFEITDRVASFEWSIDELKDLHLQLSREMNRETDAILEFDVTDDRPLAKIA